MNHLVVGAIALLDVVPAEPDGAIVDDSGLLKGKEFFITAVGWDEALSHRDIFAKRLKGRKD